MEGAQFGQTTTLGYSAELCPQQQSKASTKSFGILYGEAQAEDRSVTVVDSPLHHQSRNPATPCRITSDKAISHQSTCVTTEIRV
jgi:hypothetical protein